jgi:hypothetical protein
VLLVVHLALGATQLPETEEKVVFWATYPAQLALALRALTVVLAAAAGLPLKPRAATPAANVAPPAAMMRLGERTMSGSSASRMGGMQ